MQEFQHPARPLDEPVVFVTGNDGKYREARLVISNLERVSLEIPEFQAPTIQGVIQSKLEWARVRLPNVNLLVEDSGILATSWGCGLLPGPYTKDFLKNFSLEELVEEIGIGAPGEAVTVVGFVTRPGETFFGSGSIQGTFVKPRGTGGFGWDPIFVPGGQSRTFAEMSAEEKSAISMRQLALRDLLQKFESRFR